MTQVKVGQVWKDKDKRRNTVIEIIELVQAGSERIDTARGIIVGTEKVNDYSVDRLVKRWELIEEKPEPVFEWDGKGSIKNLTEHAHVHTHGECVKNRYDVPCDVPKAQVAVWVGKKPEVIIPGSTKEELEEARVELKAAASKNWQLKAVCQENDDYKVRFTKRIAEVYGMPLCPCHKKPLVFTEGH